jgi:hypothetical protein
MKKKWALGKIKTAYTALFTVTQVNLIKQI